MEFEYWQLLLFPASSPSAGRRRGSTSVISSRSRALFAAVLFPGLNFLLNEQPDRAIESLCRGGEG